MNNTTQSLNNVSSTNMENTTTSDSVIMNLAGVELNYPSFHLGPIDLSIHSCSVMALMGKNGSGKTTLLRLLTGSIDPTCGSITFMSKPFRPESYLLKRSLGYLPQTSILPKWSTATEILSYALRLSQDNTSKISSFLKYWQIDSYTDLPMGACSGGMQKRVALCLATITDPELLVLDEPFSGLDLYHIKALKDIIQQRTEQHKATLICTHMAPYAATLCNELVVMKDGRITQINSWKDQDYDTRINQVESLILG